FLRRVCMSDFNNHVPHRLSGGQKHRVVFASAIALQPEVLILDESTSMLVPEGRQDVLNILKKLHGQLDTTILYITHDLTEISSSDKVVVMNKGAIVLEGDIEEIYNNNTLLR